MVEMTVALEAGIVGRDPETLCAFYTGVMGFTLVGRLDHAAGAVYKLRQGDARLKLFFSVDAIDAADAGAANGPWFRPGGWRYAALYLRRPADVDDLAAAVDASGGRVLIRPTDHREHARMALVCDPEGNVWELLAEARPVEEQLR